MEASRSEGTHVAGQGDARRAREDFGEIWEAYFPSPWRWDRHVTGLISGPGQTSQSGCWLILARGEQRGTAREPCPNAWQCIPSQPTQLRGLVSRRRWEVFNVMLRSDVFFFGQQPMSCFWWRMALGAEWETLVVEMHVAPPAANVACDGLSGGRQLISLRIETCPQIDSPRWLRAPYCLGPLLMARGVVLLAGLLDSRAPGSSDTMSWAQLCLGRSACLDSC
jgi:hypothetical protein